MIDPADAVPTVFAHHRIAGRLRVLLDGVADVAEVGPGAHPLDRAPHGGPASLGEAPRLDGRLADVVHATGIAVIAILNNGHVNIEQVAVLEHPVVGNPVTNHVVDRGAHCLREPPVADVGRDRVLDPDDVIVADPVQIVGADAGRDMLPDHVQHVGREAAGHAQFGLFFRGLDRDLGGAEHGGTKPS